MKPSIYYVRHGETDWNATGRFQGSQDIPINARGEAQALTSGQILRELMWRHGRDPSKLDYVSSPMIRARATMNIIRPALGLPVQGYACDHRLREVGYGTWEGLTTEEMRQRDPEIFRARDLDKWNTTPPSGENYVELERRVASWYGSLVADTVVVAHGGTLRALMVTLGVLASRDAVNHPVEQGIVYVFSGPDMSLFDTKTLRI